MYYLGILFCLFGVIVISMLFMEKRVESLLTPNEQMVIDCTRIKFNYMDGISYKIVNGIIVDMSCHTILSKYVAGSGYANINFENNTYLKNILVHGQYVPAYKPPMTFKFVRVGFTMRIVPSQLPTQPPYTNITGYTFVTYTSTPNPNAKTYTIGNVNNQVIYAVGVPSMQHHITSIAFLKKSDGTLEPKLTGQPNIIQITSSLFPTDDGIILALNKFWNQSGCMLFTASGDTQIPDYQKTILNANNINTTNLLENLSNFTSKYDNEIITTITYFGNILLNIGGNDPTQNNIEITKIMFSDLKIPFGNRPYGNYSMPVRGAFIYSLSTYIDASRNRVSGGPSSNIVTENRTRVLSTLNDFKQRNIRYEDIPNKIPYLLRIFDLCNIASIKYTDQLLPKILQYMCLPNLPNDFLTYESIEFQLKLSSLLQYQLIESSGNVFGSIDWNTTCIKPLIQAYVNDPSTTDYVGIIMNYTGADTITLLNDNSKDPNNTKSIENVYSSKEYQAMLDRLYSKLNNIYTQEYRSPTNTDIRATIGSTIKSYAKCYVIAYLFRTQLRKDVMNRFMSPLTGTTSSKDGMTSMTNSDTTKLCDPKNPMNMLSTTSQVNIESALAQHKLLYATYCNPK